MTLQRLFRVLIVEDHPIVCRGYTAVIDSQVDLKVCGFAATMAEALAEANATRPHLVIVDISLEQGNGIALIKELRARNGHLKVLVVSAHDETMFAERALEAGALGYINKQEATESLLKGIRAVLAGDVFFSEQISNRLMKRRVGLGRSREEGSLEFDQLTDRELEVFHLIGHGETTGQIADRLHLSPKTIERYRENIKFKLGLANATQLLQRATHWVMENS